MTTSTDPTTELIAAIKLGRQLADQARAYLEAVTPILNDAIRHQSGQSRKIEALLWSCWNESRSPHPRSGNRAGILFSTYMM